MSGAERTEPASGKKLSQLREKGSFARSQELSTAVTLLAAMYLLQWFAPAAAMRMQALFVGSFTDVGVGAVAGRTAEMDMRWAEQALGRLGEAWLLSMAPFIGILPVVGVGMALAQGSRFTPQAAVDFNRLNPISGFQRYFSSQGLMELLKAIGNVSVVSVVVGRALWDAMGRLPRIQGSSDPLQMTLFVATETIGVLMASAQAVLGLGVLDYVFQRWNFFRNAMMTKQEVKDEAKGSELAPEIKGQIRQRQRKLARQKHALVDVPSATVVVTNPTHVAVALKYDRAMRSPKVVAKGADLLAQRIKEIAGNAGIPIVENKPLARGLYATAEIGEDIPLELYQAVAEVLAYVMSMRRKRL